MFRLGLLGGCVSLLRAQRGAARVADRARRSRRCCSRPRTTSAPHGEPFTAHAFAFRALAGVAFGAIFWYRSLAHAVYAHVLYDLVVAATS